MLTFVPDGWEGIAASVVLFVCAAVQGAVGFGLALLAAPILILIDPALVPGPLLFASLGLTALVCLREWRDIDFRGLGFALAGTLVGAPLGAGTLLLLPRAAFPLLVAGTVFAGVVLSVVGLRFPRTPLALAIAGIVSGVMGTTTSINGPPLALVYQHDGGPRLRGTLAGYFVSGALVSLPVLALVGRFGREELLWGAVLLPGAVLGFLVSSWLAVGLDRSGRTRQSVLALATLAGLAALTRAWG